MLVAAIVAAIHRCRSQCRASNVPVFFIGDLPYRFVRKGLFSSVESAIVRSLSQ